MGPLPFLTVVVPTRDRAGLLHDCIESLRAQDFPGDSYEIIVVDDGSSDNTHKVASNAVGRTNLPRVRYVSQDARGLNAARNAGVKRALGNPIIFVDDDVLAPPTWLRAIFEGSLRHPDAGCMGGPVRLRLEGKPPRICDRDRLGESELNLGDSERSVDFVIGANFAIRREAIGLIGPFDEVLPTYGDEIEWEVRLLRAGGQVMYLPAAWLWHRRTSADLRVRRLLRTRFQRGRALADFSRVIGDKLSLRRELASIPRFLAHAVIRRCMGGVLSAAAHAGTAWGLIRPRVDALNGENQMKKQSSCV
jgi:GT2 family glycosyltransferase